MSAEYLLDPTTNDITFENGKVKIVTSNSDWARQRLQIRLRTWLTEWFMNAEFGLPYRQEILKKNVSKEKIDTFIIQEVGNIEIISDIIYLESEIVERSYRADIKVKVIPRTIPNPITQQEDDWVYPTPPDSNVPTPPEDLNMVEISNELYTLIHVDLPITGSSTWYNLWVS